MTFVIRTDSPRQKAPVAAAMRLSLSHQKGHEPDTALRIDPRRPLSVRWCSADLTSVQRSYTTAISGGKSSLHEF